MSSRPTRSVPIVVLPGWQGSGEGHWQTWLEAQLRADGRETVRPDFASYDFPDLTDWLAALHRTLGRYEPGSYDVIAHSLGTVLWLHHVVGAGDFPAASRVLLVAPPSPDTEVPEVAAFFPVRLDADAVRHGAAGTVLVGTDDDPYLPEGIREAYGLPLDVPTTVIAGGGHLNPDAGYGEWPAVLDWCRRDDPAFG